MDWRLYSISSMFLLRKSTTSTRANIIVSHLNNTGITKLGKVFCVHHTVSTHASEAFQFRELRTGSCGMVLSSQGTFLREPGRPLSFHGLPSHWKEEKGHAMAESPKPFFAVYPWRVWLPRRCSAQAHWCEDFKLWCVQWSNRAKVSRNTLFTLLCFCMMLTHATNPTSRKHPPKEYF